MIEGSAPRWKMWTDEETQLLRVMWSKGLSASKIGAEIGFTRNAVIGRLNRLKASGELFDHGVVKPAPKAARPIGEPSAKNIRRRELREARRAGIAPPPVQRVEKPKAPTNFGTDFALPESRRVGIADLEFTHCRFPLGDPSDLDAFAYCGADREPRGDGFKPYCAGHSSIAYRPAPNLNFKGKAYR